LLPHYRAIISKSQLFKKLVSPLSFPLRAIRDAFHLGYHLAATGKKAGIVDGLTAAFNLASFLP
jgi:hypothetical protein